MLIVVLGHMHLPDFDKQLIYSFHMPLFFAISGGTYFFQNKKYSFTFKEMFFNKVKTLLIPYFILNFIMLFIWIFNFKVIGYSKKTIVDIIIGIFYCNEEIYSGPSNATWFLIALFLVSILYKLIQISCKNNLILHNLIIIFFLIFGYWLSIYFDKDLFWNILSIPTAMSFYHLGYLFFKYYSNICCFFNNNFKRIVLGIFFLILGVFCAANNVRISLHLNNYGNLFLFYIAAISLSMVFVFISMSVPTNKIITFVGKNTLYYLAIHCSILRMMEQLSRLTYTFVYSYPYITGILIYVCLIPIVYIWSKYLPVLPRKKG